MRLQNFVTITLFHQITIDVGRSVCSSVSPCVTMKKRTVIMFMAVEMVRLLIKTFRLLQYTGDKLLQNQFLQKSYETP